MSSVARAPWRWLNDAVQEEGSTRSLALIRIGLVLLLWARWAKDLAAFQSHDMASAAIAASFYVCTVLVLVGIRTRVTGWLLALSTTGVVVYVDFVLRDTSHHHTALLLVVTWLMALAPAGRSLSWDRLRPARDSGGATDEIGPLWPQRLIALQVSSVYFWSAVDKSTWAWFSGQRLQMIFMEQYTDFVWPEWSGFTVLMALGGAGSLMLEYALAFGLWVPRLRRVLLPLGLLFHAIIYVTLPVATYSLTMALLYLAFIPPERVHVTIERLLGRSPLAPP